MMHRMAVSVLKAHGRGIERLAMDEHAAHHYGERPSLLWRIRCYFAGWVGR